jgi:pimeloyl-ACP methyl ester carboxylesterase
MSAEPDHNDPDIEMHRFAVDSRTLFYRVAGDGPPLVLVHGLSGSGRWWSKNMRALAQRFRVYVVDLPGFGSSHGRGQAWVRGGQFVLSEAAHVLLHWLDAQNLDRFHLVGHSMGGYISADLAAHFPQRVERLVLVDAAAVPIRQPLARSALQLASAVSYLPADFLPVLVTDSIKAGPLTLFSAIREILSSDITEKLANIQADLLIVWGENDTLLPVSMGEELHRRLPGARFVVVAGAGHNPMWDRPEVFNPLVMAFLEGA